MKIIQAVFTISVAVVIASPAITSGKTDVIYAKYKYVMGDNDTKNDAKRIAFIEAKRRLMEKVGVFVSSDTEVSNFRLTKDQIRSYTAAILQVEVVSEQVKFENETMTMFMVVKANVDVAEVRRNLKTIQEDNVLRKKVEAQQRKIAELENRSRGLQKELARSNYEKSIKLRKERNVVFGKLSKAEKIKIIIRKATASVSQIESGMTTRDVITILGKPRAVGKCSSSLFYNYGKLWIYFEDHVATGYIEVKDYSGPCFGGRFPRGMRRLAR